MHELVSQVKKKVKANTTSLRKLSREADVNYWWLVSFANDRNGCTGFSEKGLRYIQRLDYHFAARRP